jgi:hypothetical protein
MGQKQHDLPKTKIITQILSGAIESLEVDNLEEKKE